MWWNEPKAQEELHRSQQFRTGLQKLRENLPRRSSKGGDEIQRWRMNLMRMNNSESKESTSEFPASPVGNSLELTPVGTMPQSVTLRMFARPDAYAGMHLPRPTYHSHKVATSQA